MKNILLPKFPKSSGTAKEFRDWDLKLQAEYPIRWKIAEALSKLRTVFIWRPYNKIIQIKWWVLYRLHPRHRYTFISSRRLPPGYYDSDTLILYTVFEIFERFMDIQLDPKKCCTQWEFSEEQIVEGVEGGWLTREYAEKANKKWSTMMELYTWWTKKRPNRQDVDLPELPEEWGFLACINEDFDNTPEKKAWKEATQKQREWNKHWGQEDNEMLMKLIEIRHNLWD